MTKELVDFTIGITAHSEGILAHKTMLSIFEATKLLDKHKVAYEIIINIDNGDTVTKKYFSRYAKHPKTKILNSTFADLGLSRNNIVKMAKGKYISFLDADDLISADWYYSAYQLLSQSKEPILVHPEISYSFGPNHEPPAIWRQQDSYDRATNAFLLCSVNCWVSTIAGPKSIFEKYPYPKTEHGYGNEDLGFNIATISANIPHKVADGTVLFYRRKASNSLLSANNVSQLTQRYSDLFNIDYFKNLDPLDTKLPDFRPDLFSKPVPKSGRSVVYRHGSKVYRAIKKNILADRIITPVAYRVVGFSNRVRNHINNSNGANIQFPDTIIDAAKKTSAIDNVLYPTIDKINGATSYYPEAQVEFSIVYHRLIQPVTRHPDQIIIVDSIKPNMENIKKILVKSPKKHFAIIATKKGTSSQYTHQLPNNCDIIDFAKEATYINIANYQRLFTMLITQLQCHDLHIINSEFAFSWVNNHQELIEYNYHAKIISGDLEITL